MKTSKEYAGPAWDIGITGKKWEIDKAARVEITEQGPARATIRVVRRFRDSAIHSGHQPDCRACRAWTLP